MLKIKKLVIMALLVTASMVFTTGQAMAVDAKVNINTAPVAELMQLDKINELYAQMIIEYREKNGPFTTAEDILKVTGIDAETYEINKNNIIVVSEEPVSE